MTTYVTAPSHEQLEAAWWDLMQGELGVDHDHHVAEFMRTLYDHVRAEVSRGVPIVASDGTGEPLAAVGAPEMARRMVAAYAELFY